MIPCSTMKSRRLLFAIAVALPLSQATAANLWWEGGSSDFIGTGDGISAGGSGTWNTGTKNWDYGVGENYVKWDNGFGVSDTAIFGGTVSGTVTLGEAVTVNRMTFSTAGYTISGAYAITLAGTTPTLTTDQDATISAQLAGSSLSLTKTGTASLILSGNNTYTGATTINAGILSVSSLADGGLASNIGASAANAANLVFGGDSTLRYTGGAQTTNRGFTINTGVQATIEVDSGGELGFTGAIPTTNGGLIKSGNGLLRLAAANDYKGGTSIIAGTLRLDNSTAAGDGHIFLEGTGAKLQLDNGLTVANPLSVRDTGDNKSLRYLGNSTTIYSGNITILETGANNFDVEAVTGTTLTLSGTIQGTGAAGITKMGGGTVEISGTNTYTGQTTVSAGKLVLSNNSAVGTGAIAVSGASSVLEITTGVTLNASNDVTVSNSGAIVMRGVAANTGSNTTDDYTVGTTGALKSSFASSTPDTTAKILAGTNSGSATALAMQFSGTSNAINDAIRQSDVFSISGSTGSDAYVLQLTATGLGLGSALGWENGSNLWELAVNGNTGPAGTYAGNHAMSFATFLSTYGSFNAVTMLGAYGYDSGGSSVWAVVNHGGSFAAVPEPTTALAGLLLAAGLLRHRRDN